LQTRRASPEIHRNDGAAAATASDLAEVQDGWGQFDHYSAFAEGASPTADDFAVDNDHRVEDDFPLADSERGSPFLPEQLMTSRGRCLSSIRYIDWRSFK
jgi:hypothetical protein